MRSKKVALIANEEILNMFREIISDIKNAV